ncbi:MAG TPA: arginine--tRNA ligase, partial [bacterium]|nr:arginine--tRNA ligase [bacterium]
MPSLLQELTVLVQDAFEAAGLERRFGAVVASARPDLCQFQCNGAMPAAKAAGMNPRQAAEKALERLRGNPAFSLLELAGPGFINLNLDDAWLAARAQAQGSLAGGRPEAGAKIIIDFGGPNVAKPLHVGHLRSAIIGDCLQRRHRALGAEVLSDIHLGDWGTQMGMLIEGVREEQPRLPYFNPEYAEPYPEKSPVTLEDLERLYP